MKQPSSLPLFCLALGLLGGCKDDESQLPAPATKPAPAAAPANANEPPPFTSADSSPHAVVEDGAAQAPQFTPPTSEPGIKAGKTAPKATRSREAATPPPSTSSTAAVVPSESGEWVLQVGIHKTEDGAQAMATKLKAKGFPAYVLRVSTAGTGLSGSYYRVRIGAFATRDDALRYGENVLKPAGLKDFWADKKSNEAKAREAQLPTP